MPSASHFETPEIASDNLRFSNLKSLSKLPSSLTLEVPNTNPSNVSKFNEDEQKDSYSNQRGFLKAFDGFESQDSNLCLSSLKSLKNPHFNSLTPSSTSPCQNFTNPQLTTKLNSSSHDSQTHESEFEAASNINTQILSSKSPSQHYQNKPQNKQLSLFTNPSRKSSNLCHSIELREGYISHNELGAKTQPVFSNPPPKRHFLRLQNRSCSNYLFKNATMAGSYEESLLSGRMSAPASHPIPFSLKLGVIETHEDSLGHVKMPKHISTQFEAVFYDHKLHNTGVPGKGGPYVGHVDLERLFVCKNLDKIKCHLTQNSSKRTKLSQASLKLAFENNDFKEENDFGKRNGFDNNITSLKRLRSTEWSEKHFPSLLSNKKLPFPGYRIPAKGKIQILISNSHKTAVKVFLISYDVTDLEVNQRTFLRYKIFMENGTEESNIRSDTISTSENQADAKFDLRTTSNNIKQKPKRVLVQAAHLQILRVSKTRFYLYGDLRLVFQNRTEFGMSYIKDTASPSESQIESVVPNESQNSIPGYIKIRDKLVVSTMRSDNNTFQQDVEAAYWKVLDDTGRHSCQENHEENKEGKEKKMLLSENKTINTTNFSKPDVYKNIVKSLASDQSSAFHKIEFDNELKRKYEAHKSANAIHNPESVKPYTTSASENQQTCYNCLENHKNTLLHIEQHSSFVFEPESSATHNSNVFGSEDLNEKLMNDMKAVSQKSFIDAPGII